jgi:hypothetical protein
MFQEWNNHLSAQPLPQGSILKNIIMICETKYTSISGPQNIKKLFKILIMSNVEEARTA